MMRNPLRQVGLTLLVGAFLMGASQCLAEGDSPAPTRVPSPDSPLTATAVPIPTATPTPTPTASPSPSPDPKPVVQASPAEAEESALEHQVAYRDYRAALIAQDFETALIYARKGHAFALRDLGLRNAQTGVLAYNLGAVSYRLERYRDGLPPLLEAEKTYAENYGLDSTKNLLPIRKLASTYEALGNWPEAERYSVRAIEIIEAEQGRTAKEITEILMDLTQITQHLGEAKRMRSYANRALYNMHQGEDSNALAIGHAYISLTTAEIMLGDALAANKSLDRAIEIYESQMPPEDPRLLRLYAFAADTFDQTGRPGSARKYRRRISASEN